ncbi:MAG: class I SAM-dependent rRNA methyltransferase [Planctomycetes bacterium]|nr:class I SAM-dependent rRNA methyltransferase [Planctomycetota bacterium]
MPTGSFDRSTRHLPAAGRAERISPWVQLRSASQNPLVYQKMIRETDPSARAGAIVNVYGRDGELFGRGIFNPRSQIVVRMLTWGDAPLDDAFWLGRLGEAVELRRRFRIDEATDAYRLVHAEGDGLSGLIVERYADCLAFELFSIGMFQRASEIARMLGQSLGPPACLDRPHRAAPDWRVVVRADERIQRIEGFRLPASGDSRRAEPESVVIREHGVRYHVDLLAGHKTGFFCDQRENRKRLATLCRDAAVLDVCCYTGGFSLCAKLLGGAAEVTAVDLDETAVALARENANLNQTRIDFVHADAYVYMRQMAELRRRYDVVVLDPPKFAPARADLEDALARYYDLNVLGARLVSTGGFLLTCSCSGLVSREMFAEAKGVLDIAIADERPTAENPTGLVLRAIANIMLNRPDEALKALNDPLVGDQFDAPLWRAFAYARQSKWPEARSGFRNVEASIATLPIELQQLALKEAMRAAIEVRDFSGATDSPGRPVCREAADRRGAGTAARSCGWWFRRRTLSAPWSRGPDSAAGVAGWNSMRPAA